MEKLLLELLKEKIVIVTIGNPFKGDDALAGELADRLKDFWPQAIFDAGTTPENYIGKIAREKPAAVLLIDALDLGREPGTVELLTEDKILKSGLSTHDMSAHFFIDRLKAETGARIYLLGVQPKGVSFGEAISEPVQNALNRLEDIFRRSCPCTKHT